MITNKKCKIVSNKDPVCIDFRFPLVGRAVLRNAERTGQTTGASDPRAREISNRAPA